MKRAMRCVKISVRRMISRKNPPNDPPMLRYTQPNRFFLICQITVGNEMQRKSATRGFRAAEGAPLFLAGAWITYQLVAGIYDAAWCAYSMASSPTAGF